MKEDSTETPLQSRNQNFAKFSRRSADFSINALWTWTKLECIDTWKQNDNNTKRAPSEFGAKARSRSPWRRTKLEYVGRMVEKENVSWLSQHWLEY